MKRFTIFNMFTCQKIKPKLKPKTSFLCPLFLSLLMFPLTANAAVYTVKAGDTLYNISLHYKVSVQSIQKSNGLKDSLIFPGQKITIPDAGSNTTPPVTSRSNVSNSSNSKTENSKDKVTYTVQAGDCLYNIAMRYGTSVEALMSINGISSTNLHPGQTLLLPGPLKAGQVRPAAANASSRSSSAQPVKQVLNMAVSLLGHKYVYGGVGPDVFDCSGFVAYVYKGAAGLNLPHNAEEQAALGSRVDKSSLQPGDLVFFSYYGGKGISHVGIYAGDNRFIHASSNSCVKYSSLSEEYYEENYQGARRLLKS